MYDDTLTVTLPLLGPWLRDFVRGILSKIVRRMGEAGGWVRGFNSVFSRKHMITVFTYLVNQVEILFNAILHIISTFYKHKR